MDVMRTRMIPLSLSPSYAPLTDSFQTLFIYILLLHKFPAHSMVLKQAYHVPLAKLLFQYFID